MNFITSKLSYRNKIAVLRNSAWGYGAPLLASLPAQKSAAAPLLEAEYRWKFKSWRGGQFEGGTNQVAGVFADPRRAAKSLGERRQGDLSDADDVADRGFRPGPLRLLGFAGQSERGSGGDPPWEFTRHC